MQLKNLIVVIAVMLAFIPFSAWAETPAVSEELSSTGSQIREEIGEKSQAEALAGLDELNIPFTEDAFVEYAEKGRTHIIGLFLDAGMSPDVETSAGDGAESFRPLHAAAREGHKDVAALLLDRGADVNAKTSEGKSASQYAKENGRDDTAKLLRDAGAWTWGEVLGTLIIRFVVVIFVLLVLMIAMIMLGKVVSKLVEMQEARESDEDPKEASAPTLAVEPEIDAGEEEVVAAIGAAIAMAMDLGQRDSAPSALAGASAGSWALSGRATQMDRRLQGGGQRRT